MLGVVNTRLVSKKNYRKGVISPFVSCTLLLDTLNVTILTVISSYNVILQEMDISGKASFKLTADIAYSSAS